MGGPDDYAQLCWDQYLDGRRWLIDDYVEYKGPLPYLRTKLYSEARRRKLTIKTKVHYDDEHEILGLIVQAQRPEPLPLVVVDPYRGRLIQAHEIVASGRSKYPWYLWFDGEEHWVHPDYWRYGNRESFRTSAYSAAQMLNLRVTIRWHNDRGVQGIPIGNGMNMEKLTGLMYIKVRPTPGWEGEWPPSREQIIDRMGWRLGEKFGPIPPYVSEDKWEAAIMPPEYWPKFWGPKNIWQAEDGTIYPSF